MLASLGILSVLLRLEIQDDDKIAGDRGLPISSHVPSFTPTHLTGPSAGKKECPLCKYGLVPQLQIWVQDANIKEGLAAAKQADAMASGMKGKLVPYLIVVGGKDRTDLIKASGLKSVFAVRVPSWEDPETSGLYGHSVKDRPAVRVYSVVNRRLFGRWDNPKPQDWKVISSTAMESARFQTTYDKSDPTIAPAWEPGQRMEVKFKVVDSRKQPLSGIKVSAMQTDKGGNYNPPNWGRRDPRLQALAWTDKNGWITFTTIYPGPYPGGDEPSHIHFSAGIGGKTSFRTLWFEGDPLLTKEKRAWAERDAETVVVPISRTGPIWKVSHTFVTNP